MSYKLWLEFEEFEESEEIIDFFNCQLVSDNGVVYALNVWTKEFFMEEMKLSFSGNNSYFVPPDLIVENPDRKSLEEVFDMMIKNEELKEEWISK